MFAFVFVVMVPLYNVLCDVLGINGKTNGQAYTAVEARVDESRTVTVQFIATNNAGMPWQFSPTKTAMKVHPGAVNDTVFFAHNPRPDAMIAPGRTKRHTVSSSEVSAQNRVFLF